MRIKTAVAICLSVIGTSGCYHVAVITGAPAASTTIDKNWQNSFVFGLVPPGVISTKADCPKGIAMVETERSFLNGLVAGLTDDLYTPMHTKVTCAAGPTR